MDNFGLIVVHGGVGANILKCIGIAFKDTKLKKLNKHHFVSLFNEMKDCIVGTLLHMVKDMYLAEGDIAIVVPICEEAVADGK